MNFDFYFYCHEYIDAAADISLGWYQDAFHHFVSAGRHIGYLPRQADRPNVSKGKRARLSSIASELEDGPAEEQAVRVCEGNIGKGYAFRTQEESSPWWMIDLGQVHEITDIYIFNRNDSAGVAMKAASLEIELSQDGCDWICMHRCPPHSPFLNDLDPGLLRWYPRPSVRGRYLRLIIRHHTSLHLREIAIHGQPL